jgi:phytoene dehydrogenase-like protein
MPGKEMVIIGAGMGGLAAGIYAQANGHRTRIFESHTVPGGQAATWKRKGYSFDGCVHHLFGCRPGTHLYRLWNELGVMPRELAQTRECVAAMAPDGREFVDYYDLELLESHLKELAPADAAVIDEYLRGIRLAARHDFYGEMILGSKLKMLPMLPAVAALRKWFKPTMADWGRRFSDPFLQRACPLLEYSFPEAPAILHLLKHAHGLDGDIRWPVGGARGLAQSMAERYDEEKQRVADQVIAILERRWPGLRQDVEVVDVPTLQTWKRFMGGYQGFNDMPNKPFDIMASLGGKVDSRLPGLEGFRFVGSWATSAGALFMNALSGRTVVAELCGQDGVRFRPPA